MLQCFDALGQIRATSSLRVKGLLQLPGVVGHYEIGHEGQGAGDHPDFCQIASASHRDRADVNRSLQSVHGLAALEHLVDRVPEVRQSEVITQVNGAQEFAE